jgi:hypothetical protein
MTDYPQALPDPKPHGTIGELVASIRRDLTYAQTKITDLTAALDALGHTDAGVPRRNYNAPVTATGACPSCGIAGGQHTADCERGKEHAA